MADETTRRAKWQALKTAAGRTLADASKERWHDKERALLAAIEAEMAREEAF